MRKRVEHGKKGGKQQAEKKGPTGSRWLENERECWKKRGRRLTILLLLDRLISSFMLLRWPGERGLKAMCVTVTRTPNKKLQMSLTMAPVTRRKRKETAGGVTRKMRRTDYVRHSKCVNQPSYASSLFLFVPQIYLQPPAIIILSLGVNTRPTTSNGRGHPSSKAKTPAHTSSTAMLSGEIITDQLITPANNTM